MVIAMIGASIKSVIRVAMIPVILINASLLQAQDFYWYDDPDNWQFGSDNYWVCAKLVDGSAKTRYADGTPVSETSAYDVTDQMNSDQCGYGWVRLDHREILEVMDHTGAVVQQLVWHKGGQDYDSPQPPYGWVDINDISLFDGALEVPTAQNVPLREGTQPETEGMAPIGMPLVSNQPLSYGAPYWNSGEDMWDTTSRLGKGCTAEENVLYQYKMVPTSDPDGIPRSWQYKQFTTSSRYNKYADGGANYGDGTAEYAWLMWNFLTRSDGETKVGGGGQMRGLIKEGQEFHRCKVKSIIAKAWEYDGDSQVGEITAWYVKTRGNPYSPWMYGWMIAEHRVKNPDGSFGPSILHYEIASVTFAANAGPDRTVYTYSDSATLTLNGAASTGAITSYQWSLDGRVIATGEHPRVTLPLGTHEILLRVTDTSETISEDVFILAVETAPEEIKYEAEAAMITSGNVKTGGTGEYADLQSGGSIRWDIPVYEDAYYELVFNVAVPSSSTRSMGVFVNGTKIGTVTTSSTDFSDRSVTSLLETDHTIIELKDTEGTAELDVDFLKVRYYEPASSLSHTQHSGDEIKIFPNPFTGNGSLYIEFSRNLYSNCTVEIHTLNGEKIYHRAFTVTDNIVSLKDIHLNEGYYIVGISYDFKKYYKKLITSI
jgi:hypothetical protein